MNGSTTAQEATALLTLEQVIECSVVRRVNRFVVEIQIGDREFHAWINNTGRLYEYLVRGRRAFCLPRPAGGKTQYRLFAFREGRRGALIDTQLQMRAFERCICRGLLPWLTGFREFRRNARLGESLIDYLLTHHQQAAYLEVKSAVLRNGPYAMYPDCPTLRGQKHVRELTHLAESGARAHIAFVAALPAVQAFRPNQVADADLTTLLCQAQRSGVDIRAVGMFYEPQACSINLYEPDLPIRLPAC